MPESRQYNADYYDAFEFPLDDLKLYESLVGPESTVLELGCGTGRITHPLAKKVQTITGVDISDTMLERAWKKKLAENITFTHGDICKIQLHETFDLVISPYRVFQALETEAQVHGFFQVIRRHLKSAGVGVVNVFNPKFSAKEMPLKWKTDEETFCGETTLINGDLLKFYDTRKKINVEKQVLHPEMIYRRYDKNGKLVDEHINPICMRYYYPEEFKQLIVAQGYEILQTWGGYNGEEYGKGPELIIAFRKQSK